MPCIDEKCTDGVLVFDQVSGPKWKMNCNQCNSAMFLPERAKKVFFFLFQIVVHHKETCPNCGTTIMSIDYNRKSSPLEEGQTLRKGCINCDEVLRNSCSEGHTKITYGRRKYKKGGKKGRKREDPRMSFDRF